uniref:Receptor expression-enhancing protein n=1 Tax=Toxocara canis TaxID=6265 RepID=A0A183UUB1_TOXCA
LPGCVSLTYYFCKRREMSGGRKSTSQEKMAKTSAEKAQKGRGSAEMKSAGAFPKTEATINSFSDINPVLMDLLYNKLSGQAANDVKDLEEKSGVKREQFVYAMAVFVAGYLVFGSEAGLMCNLIGFIYPAFATLQMIESSAKEQAIPWLVYWTVFGAFSLTDFYAENIRGAFPVYWFCKAVFLLYLFLPQTCGAQKFYEKVVLPTIGRVELAIVHYDSKKKEMSAWGLVDQNKVADRERAGERPSAEMACKRSAEKVKAGTRTSSGVTVINTFGDVNPALLDLLYNKIGGQLANDVKNLEIRTGIRREQVMSHFVQSSFVYAMMAFVAIYLVFGKEAGLLCNLIVFIYPAYATLQVSSYINSIRSSMS